MWTFRKELLLNPIGSAMDVEDSNSNQMDVDEHSMSSDLMNNLNHSNASLLNRTQNNRVNRVDSAAAHHCSLLVVFRKRHDASLRHVRPVAIWFLRVNRVNG